MGIDTVRYLRVGPAGLGGVFIGNCLGGRPICSDGHDRAGPEGKLSATDGPFAETKEQLAGFYLIEARDLNDAIQAAAKIPPAREGSVEVRPVRELNP